MMTGSQASYGQAGPHASTPPQPSGITPQVLPWAAHVVGVQQRFLLQTLPASHVPQFWYPLQPSLARPQLKPWAEQVWNAHACCGQRGG